MYLKGSKKLLTLEQLPTATPMSAPLWASPLRPVPLLRRLRPACLILGLTSLGSLGLDPSAWTRIPKRLDENSVRIRQLLGASQGQGGPASVSRVQWWAFPHLPGEGC